MLIFFRLLLSHNFLELAQWFLHFCKWLWATKVLSYLFFPVSLFHSFITLNAGLLKSPTRNTQSSGVTSYSLWKVSLYQWHNGSSQHASSVPCSKKPLHSVRLSITRACNTCSRIPLVSSLSLTFNYIASPCFCNYCLPIIISEQYSVPHNQATIVNNISRPRNYNSHNVIRNDNGKFYYHA